MAGALPTSAPRFAAARPVANLQSL